MLILKMGLYVAVEVCSEEQCKIPRVDAVEVRAGIETKLEVLTDGLQMDGKALGIIESTHCLLTHAR